MRPTGIEASSLTRPGEPGGLPPAKSSVSIGPGATQLTVMPSRASSSAALRVSATTAPLVAP